MLVVECVSTDLVNQLQALGYTMTSDWGDRPLGYIQAVQLLPNGTLVGVADSKRMAVASAMAF